MVEKAGKKATDLVDFQRRLNRNLDEAGRGGEGASVVGFSTGGVDWLIELEDMREIAGVPEAGKVARLGLAKGWVQGISNFKGHVYTLVDLQMFFGQSATVLNINSRALLLHQRHLVQAALVVQTVAGLIGRAELRELGGAELAGHPLPAQMAPWSQRAFRGGDGRVWRLLNVQALASSPQMLDVEA